MTRLLRTADRVAIVVGWTFYALVTPFRGLH
jgi:hypothetical protein